MRVATVVALLLAAGAILHLIWERRRPLPPAAEPPGSDLDAACQRLELAARETTAAHEVRPLGLNPSRGRPTPPIRRKSN